MSDTLLLVGLAASTLLSEDAACIAAGVLIREGQIPAAAGVTACAAGIYAGDALLWCVGRLCRGKRPSRVATLARHADSPLALLASRFVPGTRLFLYLAAGAFGQRPRSFFLWTAIAVLLWAPLIVLGTASSLVGGLLVIAGLRLAKRIDWRRVSQRAAARLDRWRRWEFWPACILYAPVTAHIAWLALRHGGLGTLSAANPGMPEGGFVGESKFEILTQLPPRWTLKAALITPGGVEARLDDLRRLVEFDDFVFPLVLKPDVGQRGIGVRLVHSVHEARGYFERQTGTVIAQQFHPGPFEAGIFYYRRPDEAHGRIFSITDKRFPSVVGDGRSTLEELIWAHPRYRLQASVFLRRHAVERTHVLAPGERFGLALAGNHAQGTLFLDGTRLITPALERRIDEIARSVPGFFIGRFDVRYADPERFARGEDLAIVELNGVTSEPTNIYDPSFTLFRAWRVLRRQWTLVFEIGAANRARGCEQASVARLLGLSLRHLRAAPSLPIAS